MVQKHVSGCISRAGENSSNCAVLVFVNLLGPELSVSTPPSDPTLDTLSLPDPWSALPPAQVYVPAFPRPSLKSLVLAAALFLLTLCTCLAAGTQFAVAYANHQAASLDEFLRAFTLFYRDPAGLLAGLPFAVMWKSSRGMAPEMSVICQDGLLGPGLEQPGPD